MQDPITFEFPVTAGSITYNVRFKPLHLDKLSHSREIWDLARVLLYLLRKIMDPTVYSHFIHQAAMELGLAIAPPVKRNPKDWIPFFYVKNPDHPYHGRAGEYLQGEGDTIYLWIDEKIVACRLDDLEPVRLTSDALPYDVDDIPDEPPF